MLEKIKQFWRRHKPDHYNNYSRGYADGKRDGEEKFRGREIYTQDAVSKLVRDAYSIGYNDGRSDGLSIARRQATKSLKEILWQQNKTK